jgi:dihydrolipoyl dehydrogenase
VHHPDDADAHTLAVDGGEDVTFTSAIIATGSSPLRPLIAGLESGRCVDSEGLLAQTEVPRRLVIRGGGVTGCELASIFARFGSQVTIIEMLQALIPQEDAAASNELPKHFRMRGITRHLGRQCTKVEDSGSELTVHFGDGETVMADLMLVSVGCGRGTGWSWRSSSTRGRVGRCRGRGARRPQCWWRRWPIRAGGGTRS